MNRRAFVLSLATAVIAARAEAAPPGPVETVRAIYRRAAAGKGDSGGQFLWLRSKDRHVHFSKSIAALWDRADRITPRGDQNPPGFDPVTASQDPSLKSFKLTAEQEEPESARILVDLTTREDGRDKLYASVRYHLVREGGRWLIDDIAGDGADADNWSLRSILQSHLDSYTKPAAPGARR